MHNLRGISIESSPAFQVEVKENQYSFQQERNVEAEE
jgi:hypothetical protein